MKIDIASNLSSIPAVSNPFELFAEWYAAAEKSEPEYPDGFTLSTIRDDGFPDSRVVLMKAWDERGFVFYTNFESAKGCALRANPRAALCFHWKTLHKQVRAVGIVDPVSTAEADEYFATRPRLSRLGAWASQQSREISNREALLQQLREVQDRFDGVEVPRPPHWSGFRIVPQEIEFWSEGEYRLHDRVLYSRNGTGWSRRVLSP